MGTNEVSKMYLGSIEINLGGECDEQCQCEQAGGTWDDTLNDGQGGCMMPE